MLSLRAFNYFLFILCCVLLAVGDYFELVQNAVPCSLCVIERLTLAALAGSFLLCAVQRPKLRGLWIYTAFNALAVAVGLTASGRQIWLQNQPVIEQNMCVPPLLSVIDHPLVVEVLNNLGTHHCAEAGPAILGLNLSFWTFLCFSLLGVVVLMIPLLFERVKQ